MLTVTQNAVAEIRNITDQPEAPEGTGLRISSDPDRGSLTLSLAPVPGPGDAVVEADGARLFLDGPANELLADKTLDAAVDSSGSVQFAVAEQA
jgi:Fe-S cluster assembly iron-binding protein IscA